MDEKTEIELRRPAVILVDVQDRIKVYQAPHLGEVSDGYHTFNELYDHRCLLFIALSSLCLNVRAWKSRRHDDGSEWAGWFIAGMELPTGTITYHLPDKFWDLLKSEERETAPPWDGHTPNDVIEHPE